MGQSTDLLYQPMKLSGTNFSTRYFKENEDGTYSLTPLLIRNIARDCADYCKSRVINTLDLDHKYSTVSVKTDEVEGFLIDDPESLKIKKKMDEAFKTTYKVQLAEYHKKWHEYRDNNLDEFIRGTRRVQVGGEDENRYFDHFKPNTDSIIANLSLEETMSLYKASMELFSKYDKPNGKGSGELYETLPFEEPLYSKPEFVEKHKLIRAKINEELGIPSTEFEVKKIKVNTKTTVSFIRSNNKAYSQGVISDDTHLIDYAKELIEYLTNNTVMDFKSEVHKLYSLMNNSEIIVKLSDKNIKAVQLDSNIDNGIEIFTKDLVRFITIIDTPEAFTYEYKFYNDINGINLSYNTKIITYNDLIDALVFTKNLIKGNATFAYLTTNIDSIIEALS